jgi:hypothetical protein
VLAIKLLHPDPFVARDVALRRFQQEAQLLAACRYGDEVECFGIEVEAGGE